MEGADMIRILGKAKRGCILLVVTLTLTPATAQPAASNAAKPAIPPFVERGMPGAGHAALASLAGDWRVTMSLYAAMGSPSKPLVSTDLIARRRVIGGGRFLSDETTGTMGGQPYFRRGTLGYSNMDRRFEWVTQDALNANMMIYQGAKGSGPRLPTSMIGTFTDQGLLGEKMAGRTIAQRTVITVADRDRHRIDIFFTPPGGRERLVDRKDYVRIAPSRAD